MANIYKFVPRKATTARAPQAVKKPLKQTKQQPPLETMERPYQITFKNMDNFENHEPYQLEIHIEITDRAFKTRINNILDSNNYIACYRFSNTNRAGQLHVAAHMELSYGYFQKDNVMLSVCSDQHNEPAGKISLVELTTQTVMFKHAESREPFKKAFEQTILAFIDAKYEDYQKLRARLLRRD